MIIFAYKLKHILMKKKERLHDISPCILSDVKMGTLNKLFLPVIFIHFFCIRLYLGQKFSLMKLANFLF
jgi:hypothetical protein